MNIIFFGSGNFAVASLKALIASGHKIACVVTQPDRQKGRGLRVEGTAIKNIATAANLKIYQPQRINTSEAVKFLKGLNPDLFIVIAYGQILSQEILEIPKKLCINVHASLLPIYRGAAPINRAIINGDRITGVTIIKMAEKMDAGPVITQEQVRIQDDETSTTLEDKLSQVAAGVLIQSLESMENNNYKLIEQDESKASFAFKLKKEDGLINWQKTSIEINNLIRGCLGWPGAFTHYKGKLLKIYKARVRLPGFQGSGAPGEITQVSKEGIVVATGKGNLIIEELQIEGKRIMKAEEFISGHKISLGERLGTPHLNKKVRG